jgi:hypothetical protein
MLQISFQDTPHRRMRRSAAFFGALTYPAIFRQLIAAAAIVGHVFLLRAK